MNNLGIIFRRELMSYFATPLAYIFIVIFLIAANWLAFGVGLLYWLYGGDPHTAHIIHGFGTQAKRSA